MSAEEEEARRIAEMGKPILGEHSRLEVVIEESYEFKVLCIFIVLVSFRDQCPLYVFAVNNSLQLSVMNEGLALQEIKVLMTFDGSP